MCLLYDPEGALHSFKSSVSLISPTYQFSDYIQGNSDIHTGHKKTHARALALARGREQSRVGEDAEEPRWDGRPGGEVLGQKLTCVLKLSSSTPNRTSQIV